VSDYRIEVKVRNANILRAINRKGFSTVAAFCREAGVDKHTFYALVNLKGSPISKTTGDWMPIVMRVCEVLHTMPVDLFSAEQLEPMEKTSAYVDVSLDQVQGMLTSGDTYGCPSLAIERKQDRKLADTYLDKLDPRAREVIKRRFGFEGEEGTLKSVGKSLGVHQERVRQIEAKAMRRLVMIRKIIKQS